MKKNLYIISALFIVSVYAYSSSVALSEVPKAAVAFADKYFSDYYLYRATEIGGSYTLIFKGGLKIYVNSNGEWNTISGSGDEISIDYIEEKVRNTIKREFPNEKIIYIQKKHKGYIIQFRRGNKITVDIEGNITKGRRN